MKKKTNVDAAWERIKGKSFKRWKASRHDQGVFDYVLESVYLPENVEAWFTLHGGESKPEALAPLRFVSLEEATDFALGFVGQLEDEGEHVRAAEKLAKKHFTSANKQKFSTGTEYCCVWTLALGKPGHRLALDLDAGFVVEHFADGRAEKRADSFDAWLDSLGAEAAPVKKKPVRNRRVTSKK
jgi:hypothetical protein